MNNSILLDFLRLVMINYESFFVSQLLFANRLKRLRKEKQLSQEQLSLELHVSRQAISKWETGVLPDVENLINIAHFFTCSLDYLVYIYAITIGVEYSFVIGCLFFEARIQL